MNAESQWAVECENLGRVYSSRSILGGKRETVALDDLSLQIPLGVVFGLLGPNGAGKTTTVRILSTLLTPTTGSARVLGDDVEHQARQVRRNIGFILGGDRGLYGHLTGKENLRYFGALNHLNPKESDRRARELLEQVGLGDRGDTLAEQYSRGMKQRLHIARGLLTDPKVLFMDEPTMGLDPIGAQEVRQMIPRLVAMGKTILLTTHYMFEADELCNTIAMINKGKLVALGTPTEIKQKFSEITVIDVTLKETRPGLLDEVSGIDGVEKVESGADGLFQKLSLHTRAGSDLRQQVTQMVGEANVETMIMRDPTLEEAYLNILG